MKTTMKPHITSTPYSDRWAHTRSPNKRENRWLSSRGYLVVEASLLCFPSVFLSFVHTFAMIL